MNCDPNFLATQAACYCGFNSRESDAAAIWGLCQWASQLESCQISWTPSTALAYWVDSGGIHNGFDLPTFLATADIHSVSLLNLDTAGISSLTCLEYLPNLSTLQIGGNPLLTSVDLSEVPNLVAFDGNNGGWTSFDVSHNPLLQTLNVAITPSLTSITGLLSCPNLIGLDCNQCDITGTLDLTGLANLQILNCSSNASLTTLTLTGCTALTTLDCNNCDITGALDPSSSTLLFSLDCNSNDNLTSITLTGLSSLDSLDCSNCDITGVLNVSPCVNVASVACQNNPNLSGVTLAGLVTLTSLKCFNDPNLTSLTLAGLASLVSIDCNTCGFNQIAVDNILCTLDANGCLNGVLNITSNTAPSVGVGIPCSLNLDPGKGWTVSHD